MNSLRSGVAVHAQPTLGMSADSVRVTARPFSEKFLNFLRTSAGNSVRHEAVNAMLLNEFLKAHRRIEEQEATIARLQKQIDAVTAGLQKVSAQLEASKPAPQVVNNP